MARLFRFVFSLLFFALILGVLGLSYGLVLARNPGPLTDAKIVVIEPRTGTTDMAALLERNGVIGHRYVFIMLTILKGDLGALQAGEYEFTAHQNVFDVVNKIARGQVYQHKLTIPEGLSVAEIIALVKQADGLTGDIVKMPAEGALLPETYSYTRGMTRQSMIDRMAHDMTVAVNDAWAKRNPQLKLTTPQQLVTLASIVEKETGIAAERPMVASVFYNRLDRGMKLQSDPTVIYAITHGAAPLGRLLTTNDLTKTNSPYNTYMYEGLPPAPIANPGKASLQAVAAPAQTPNIFFVANGSGGHAFAATLDEHNANVARWRALQQEQEKKAP